MGRGLSIEQLGFLSLAWRLNRLHGRSPNRGTVDAKNWLYRRGQQIMNANGTARLYRRLERGDELPEYSSRVFMHLLYGIDFTRFYIHSSGSKVWNNGIDRTSSRSKAACAALARTLNRLTDRGLMAAACPPGRAWMHDIVAEDGVAIVRDHHSTVISHISDDYLMQCIVFAGACSWWPALAIRCGGIPRHGTRFGLPSRAISFHEWIADGIVDLHERHPAAVEYLTSRPVSQYLAVDDLTVSAGVKVTPALTDNEKSLQRRETLQAQSFGHTP